MHPFAELSAYLDDALDPTAKAAVETHLDACAVCRTRLAELRGTARLIAALPAPVPSRSLVPRVSVPFWLAPIRTLATLASAAALFLFVASALLAGAPSGTGGGAAAPAAAPAPYAPNAGGAAGPTGAADQRTLVSASASPAAGFAINTPGATPAPEAQRSGQTDATKAATGTAAPAARQEAATPGPAARALGLPERPQLGPSPWFWLALAVGFGVLAFVLQRRLRGT
ncbi:MAG TPA: zf-HC2 domain-containing protein [Candidatus Limnocylindria bacterium]|nr:zf-HC2 domain-containing protein [Candidatus Limnocylindria bacterium]